MNPLDINTPLGRISAEDQHRAVEIVFGGNPDFGFIPTSDTDRAAVDGFTSKFGVVSGVTEIKTRNEGYDTFMVAFNGEWLITWQKLLDLQTIARLLHVPGYGFLYMKPDDLVVAVRIVGLDGEFTCKHRVQRTTTRATCNGGTANRENSFVDLRGANIYKGKA